MIAVRFGLLLLGVATVIVIAGCKATRGGYETAPYRVAQAHGRFEVRDYPALTVVETPVQGGGRDRLRRRISAPVSVYHRQQRKRREDCHDDPGLHGRHPGQPNDGVRHAGRGRSAKGAQTHG